MSNFSDMVQLQLSSFPSPECSSSQCSLKIYVVVKEMDLVRQDFFPLWALWYIKVLSVWHLLLCFMIFPHFPLLYLCYHYHPSWMVLNCKVRSEGRARCCHTALLSTRWQKKSQQEKEHFYCVLDIILQLKHISHLLYNPASRLWLFNIHF